MILSLRPVLVEGWSPANCCMSYIKHLINKWCHSNLSIFIDEAVQSYSTSQCSQRHCPIHNYPVLLCSLFVALWNAIWRETPLRKHCCPIQFGLLKPAAVGVPLAEMTHSPFVLLTVSLFKTIMCLFSVWKKLLVIGIVCNKSKHQRWEGCRKSKQCLTSHFLIEEM